MYIIYKLLNRDTDGGFVNSPKFNGKRANFL